MFMLSLVLTRIGGKNDKKSNGDLKMSSKSRLQKNQRIFGNSGDYLFEISILKRESFLLINTLLRAISSLEQLKLL